MSAKLLLVVPNPAFFLSHRQSLAQAIVGAGYELVVATDAEPESVQIEDAGWNWEAVPHLLGGSARDMVRAAGFLRDLASEVRPDLVHLVSVRSILASAVGLRRSGLRTLHHFTGLGYTHVGGRRLLRAFVERGYRRALQPPRAWALFQNPDDRDELCRKRIADPARSRLVLGSGVDPSRFRPSPLPEGEFSILFASRMLGMKGVRELVAAVEALRGEGLRLRLVLAGAPDPRNPSAIPERELRAWEERGGVEWRGHVADVPAELARCHVAALPSYREGLPLFLAEAAACGRPVITTDVPGCRETVRDGETGLLVPPRDVEALRGAIATLASDPERCRSMARAAPAYAAERFSSEVVDAATLAVYRELLDEDS